MKTYAVIKNNTVINTIVWDGVTPYTYPEAGVTLIEAEVVGIGDKYENGKFYYLDNETSQWKER